MTEDDAELVALIDNELDEDRKTRLLARLQSDDALRQRYDALRAAGAPLAPALDALLETAPLARLKASLAAATSRSAPAQRQGLAWRALAAGVAIGALIGGAAAWTALSLAPRAEDGDWRTAVVEYMSLYNSNTFALFNPDAGREADELRALTAEVGVAPAPADIALAGLRFKTAQVLTYESKSLGQIVYADSDGAPVLFCIIADAEADAPQRSERRGDLSLASWSHGGRGYLVIGRLPQARVADLAATLAQRF
jgi:anti-sigma factor RsiW